MRTVIIPLVVVLAVLGGTVTAEAQERAAVEVRVWNAVADADRHFISARYAGGSWNTLGTIPLPLDSETANGRYRYGDISLDVPLPDGDGIQVEIRVWKATREDHGIYVSARPEGSSWSELGTTPLPLEELSSSGNYRYGDISLSVVTPLPLPRVTGVEFIGEFTDAQRTENEEVIRQTLADISRFFRDHYDLVTPDLAFVVSVRDHPGALGFDYRDGTIYLEEYRLTPIVTEQTGGTVTFSAPEFNFLFEMAAEYIMALQDAIRPEASVSAPVWLTEGMAYYLQVRFNIDNGAVFNDSHPDYIWRDARESNTPLPRMESRGFQRPVGYLAIEQLIEWSSEEALFDFLRNLSPGTTWQAAFAESFGMSVETFYGDFAAWRAREAPYPMAAYQGVVVAPAGTSVEGIWVNVAWTRSQLDVRGNLGGVQQDRVGEDGTFSVTAFPTEIAAIYLMTPECLQVGFLSVDGGITRDGEQARYFETGLEGVSGLRITLPSPRGELCTAETRGRWWWECHMKGPLAERLRSRSDLCTHPQFRWPSSQP